MAKKPSQIRGRALVDIPGVALCGEFVTIDAVLAEQLIAAGEFDSLAVEGTENHD